MPYCSVDDVKRYAGITSDDVSDADTLEFIKDNEAEVDRLTNTTFWATEASGTADSGDTNTLTDSGFTASALIGDYLWITGGTGSGQFEKILSNSTTVITIDTDWETEPDNTSTYRVIHTGNDPRKDEDRTGDGTDTIFVYKYPVQEILSVTIDSTSVTVTELIRDDPTGEVILGNDSEQTRWTMKPDQDNNINYRYGVYPVPRDILKLTAQWSAISMLNQQMGGTHNIPSTVSLPEGSYTVGQAYVNIRETLVNLQKTADQLEKKVAKYPFFA